MSSFLRQWTSKPTFRLYMQTDTDATLKKLWKELELSFSSYSLVHLAIWCKLWEQASQGKAGAKGDINSCCLQAFFSTCYFCCKNICAIFWWYPWHQTACVRTSCQNRSHKKLRTRKKVKVGWGCYTPYPTNIATTRSTATSLVVITVVMRRQKLGRSRLLIRVLFLSIILTPALRTAHH